MNQYDDLQRFKEKMRNPALNFRDFSSQSQASEHGSWAILNQLLPATDANALAAGGHVSQAAPQPVSPDMFTSVEFAAPPEMTAVNVVNASAPTIFHGVAEQLANEPQENVAIVPVTVPTPVRAHVPDPVPTPVQAEVNFSRLFAPAVNTTAPAAEKNQPLNSLLERIASCR